MSTLTRKFLYRAKYNYGRYLNLLTPVDITLELSSFCNLRCPFCYHANQDNLFFERKYMPIAMAYEIIWQAAKFKVPALKFNWRGESTLHKEYVQILSYAQRFDFVDLISNTNMNYHDPLITAALANQTKVKISLDSMDLQTYAIHRPKGNHALVLKNIDDLMSMNPKCEVVAQFVKTKYNQDEDFTLIQKKYPQIKISVRDMVEGRGGQDVGNIATKKRDLSKRIPCNQAFVRLIFDASGNAYPCCPDIRNEYLLGNINKQNIKEIFNSDVAKRLRTYLKSGSAFRLEPCKSCSSFESYKNFKPNWNS